MTSYLFITKYIEQSCTSQMKQLFHSNEIRRSDETNENKHRSRFRTYAERSLELLSEEWIGTTRSQILRIEFPELYTWASGRRTQVQNIHDLIRSGPKNGQTVEERTRLQAVRPTRWIFDVSSEDTEYLEMISEARAHLEKFVVPSMHCFPTDEFWETRPHADIQTL